MIAHWAIDLTDEGMYLRILQCSKAVILTQVISILCQGCFDVSIFIREGGPEVADVRASRGVLEVCWSWHRRFLRSLRFNSQGTVLSFYPVNQSNVLVFFARELICNGH